MAPVRSNVLRLVFAVSGLILWAAQFLAIYVFAALACARGWTAADALGEGGVRAVLIAVSVVAALAAAFVAMRGIRMARMPARPEDGFVGWLAAAVAALAILAMVWTALPAVTVPICAL